MTPAPLLPELCSIDEEPIPSLHAIKQAANTEAWKAIHTDLLRRVTESHAISGQCCFVCSDIAQYRCVQCGPNCYCCSQCLGYSYSMANIFHIPEEWVVSHYIIVCSGVKTIKMYQYALLYRMECTSQL